MREAHHPGQGCLQNMKVDMHTSSLTPPPLRSPVQVHTVKCELLEELNDGLDQFGTRLRRLCRGRKIV